MFSEKTTEANIWPTTRLGKAAGKPRRPGELRFQGPLAWVPPRGLSCLHSKGGCSYRKDQENTLHGYIPTPIPWRQKQVYFLLMLAGILWTQMVHKASAAWEVNQLSQTGDLVPWTCRCQANPFPFFLLGHKQSQPLGFITRLRHKTWIVSQVFPFLGHTLKLKGIITVKGWEEHQQMWKDQEHHPEKEKLWNRPKQNVKLLLYGRTSYRPGGNVCKSHIWCRTGI